MINIIFNSDYTDGLFYYSYEHFRFLLDNNIETNLVIFLRFYESKNDCIKLLKSKYINVDLTLEKILFVDNNTKLSKIKEYDLFNKTNIIMGESHLFHAFNIIIFQPEYSNTFKLLIKQIYKNKLFIIHNERNIIAAKRALDYLKPKQVIFLSDHSVFPNTKTYIHYSKRIYFDIYINPIENNIQNQYMFNGSNNLYYSNAINTIESNLKYKDFIILVDEHKIDNYINYQKLIPVDDLLGIFDTFVYNQTMFDNAPRIIQECFYYNKNIDYNRNVDFIDGGKIYYELGMSGEDFNLSTYPKILSILGDEK